MACFTVTAGEAILVTAAQITVTALEHKGIIKYEVDENGNVSSKWSKKLGVLNGMLWGGSFLLALEHIFHGEVASYPPFLTAMMSAESTAEMLHEMGTVGVAMAVSLTAIWGVGLLISRLLRHRKANKKLIEADK
jgi:hypothetical protein